MDLSTSGLIADLELNALLPDGMFENSDLISFLNDGFFSEVLAFVMRFREDFYVTYTDFAPAASIAIPADAIAQKIKDVQIKKDDYTFYNLPRLSMGEITSGKSTWNKPEGFYIQDNNIIFYPRAQTNNIRLVYFKRPNYLEDATLDTELTVTTKSIYKVTGVSGATIVVTPNPVAALGAGKSKVFSHAKGYQPFDVVNTVTLVTGPSGSIFTAASTALAATFTKDDYLCNVGYTVYPKIPLEARDVLVQAALVKAMTAMKDKDGYKLAKDALAEAKAAIASLISPRIDNEVKKVVNTSSPLWGGNKGWRY